MCIRGSSGCVPPPSLGRPRHPRGSNESPEFWAYTSTSPSASEQASSVKPAAVHPHPFSDVHNTPRCQLSHPSPRCAPLRVLPVSEHAAFSERACGIRRSSGHAPLLFSGVLDTPGGRTSRTSFGCCASASPAASKRSEWRPLIVSAASRYIQVIPLSYPSRKVLPSPDRPGHRMNSQPLAHLLWVDHKMQSDGNPVVKYTWFGRTELIEYQGACVLTFLSGFWGAMALFRHVAPPFHIFEPR